KSATLISTAGPGAYGIVAQSIGGGGGLPRDPSAIRMYQNGTSARVKSNAGPGGAVSITADSARIQTTGAYAPAIFVQSIGGGGGLVNYTIGGSDTKTQARGTAGGQGSGGAITV